jgi:hypothetical protein
MQTSIDTRRFLGSHQGARTPQFVRPKTIAVAGVFQNQNLEFLTVESENSWGFPMMTMDSRDFVLEKVVQAIASQRLRQDPSQVRPITLFGEWVEPAYGYVVVVKAYIPRFTGSKKARWVRPQGGVAVLGTRVCPLLATVFLEQSRKSMTNMERRKTPMKT